MTPTAPDDFIEPSLKDSLNFSQNNDKHHLKFDRIALISAINQKHWSYVIAQLASLTNEPKLLSIAITLTDKENRNLLMLALEDDNMHLWDYIWQLAEQNNDLKLLLEGKSNNQKTLIMLTNSRVKLLEQVLNATKNYCGLDTLEHLIKVKSTNGENIFTHLILYNEKNKFSTSYDNLEEEKFFSTNLPQAFQLIIDFIASNMNFKCLVKLLTEINEEGYTAPMIAAEEGLSEVCMEFLAFLDNLMEQDKEDIIDNILSQQDSAKGNNFSMLAAINLPPSSKVLDTALDIIIKFNKPEIIKKFITISNENKCNILMLSIINHHNNFSKQLLNIISNKTFPSSIAVSCISNILNLEDAQGNNSILFSIAVGNNLVCQKLFELAKSKLGISEVKSLLERSNKDGQLIELATLSKNYKIVSTLIEYIKYIGEVNRYLDKKAIKHIKSLLNYRNNKGENLIIEAIKGKDHQGVSALLDLTSLTDKLQCKIALCGKDNKGNTPYSLALSTNQKQIEQTLINFAKKNHNEAYIINQNTYLNKNNSNFSIFKLAQKR